MSKTVKKFLKQMGENIFFEIMELVMVRNNLFFKIVLKYG